jgi:hypothetical protein
VGEYRRRQGETFTEPGWTNEAEQEIQGDGFVPDSGDDTRVWNVTRSGGDSLRQNRHRVSVLVPTRHEPEEVKERNPALHDLGVQLVIGKQLRIFPIVYVGELWDRGAHVRMRDACAIRI